MMKPDPIEERAAETLDRALARLPGADLEPWAAHSQLSAAQRRLRLRTRAPSWLERSEPVLLIAFAACHLVWALLRVIAFGARHLG